MGVGKIEESNKSLLPAQVGVFALKARLIFRLFKVKEGSSLAKSGINLSANHCFLCLS